MVEDHWSDYGLWHARKQQQRCFFAVVDDSFVLTVTSCFVINGTNPVPAGIFYRLIDGKEVDAYRLVGLIKNPYDVFNLEGDFSEMSDSEILVKVDRKMNVKEVKTKWPDVYIEKDFEDILDGYEDEHKSASVWTIPSQPVGPPLEIQTGRMLNRTECLQRFSSFCFNKMAKDKCLEIMKIHFRCMAFSWNICWNHNSRSAPVIVDDVLWGFALLCKEKVIYYRSFDRSFGFVFSLLNNPKLRLDETVALAIIIFLAAIITFVFFTIIKITVRKRREKERAKREARETKTPSIPDKKKTSYF